MCALSDSCLSKQAICITPRIRNKHRYQNQATTDCHINMPWIPPYLVSAAQFQCGWRGRESWELAEECCACVCCVCVCVFVVRVCLLCVCGVCFLCYWISLVSSNPWVDSSSDSIFIFCTHKYFFPFPLPRVQLIWYFLWFCFCFWLFFVFCLAVCTRNLSRYTISVCRGAWLGEPSRGCDCFIFICGLTWQPWQPCCHSNSRGATAWVRGVGVGWACLVPQRS